MVALTRRICPMCGAGWFGISDICPNHKYHGYKKLNKKEKRDLLTKIQEPSIKIVTRPAPKNLHEKFKLIGRPSKKEEVPTDQNFLVLMITNAYESGFGHWNRKELSNPYKKDSLEWKAWDRGRSEAAEAHLPHNNDKPTPEPGCLWKHQVEIDYHDYWSASCGEDFIFTDGGPIENGMKFCPYCGKPLKVEPPKPVCPDCGGFGDKTYITGSPPNMDFENVPCDCQNSLDSQKEKDYIEGHKKWEEGKTDENTNG